ncbi:hypothetical protein FK531_11265 [Rhodococcus spelaei]|uniref:Peptidase M50 n=1 Tax=Rhodococcus spelaei TaxID=2546320 RepID=A0A541BAX0_9NOCA|nr:hypothetical protein FK531_11265 [Rhodococcus spelaei]
MLACGGAAVPARLASLPTVTAPAVPAKPDFDELFRRLDESAEQPQRLVVVGDDGALAAALTRLMRSERLHVELAYVAAARTAATRLYGLAVGERAAERALHGRPDELPLIRDDAGTALVAEATVTGPDGGDLVGEAYVDSTRLFSGTVRSLRIAPILEQPGLRATAARGWGLRPSRWTPGRAMQLGSVGAVVTRDGVITSRAVKRSSFYRDTRQWLLVR